MYRDEEYITCTLHVPVESRETGMLSPSPQSIDWAERWAAPDADWVMSPREAVSVQVAAPSASTIPLTPAPASSAPSLTPARESETCTRMRPSAAFAVGEGTGESRATPSPGLFALCWAAVEGDAPVRAVGDAVAREDADARCDADAEAGTWAEREEAAR